MSNGTANPLKDGLDAAADLLKLTLALATGALVFGAGLTTEELKISVVVKWLLLCAWLMLAFAAALGIVAISAIPVMIAKQNYDLEYRPLTIPARLHQLSFVLGIALLGVALASALFTVKAEVKESTGGTPIAYTVDTRNVVAQPEAPLGRSACCSSCCRPQRADGVSQPASKK